MRYDERNFNGRWYRFTGRRLQLLRDGQWITLKSWRSGVHTSLMQAHEAFTRERFDAGMSLADVINRGGL